jgi:hypothetical protein
VQHTLDNIGLNCMHLCTGALLALFTKPFLHNLPHYSHTWFGSTAAISSTASAPLTRALNIW